MVSMLIAAVLSQPLWFVHQQQGQRYTVTPMAHLTTECACRVLVRFKKQTQAGSSTSQQQGNIAIAANNDVALSNMQFRLEQGDTAEITVSISDGRQVAFEQRLRLPQ